MECAGLHKSRISTNIASAHEELDYFKVTGGASWAGGDDVWGVSVTAPALDPAVYRRDLPAPVPYAPSGEQARSAGQPAQDPALV